MFILSAWIADHLGTTHTTVIAGIWEVHIPYWAMRKILSG